MDASVAIAVGIVLTVTSAGLGLAFTSPRNEHTQIPHSQREKPNIDRGLKTACMLIGRFYGEQELPIQIVSAVRGYQTATITANIPARVSTNKIMKTRKDLEHYLLAHGIGMIRDSLRLQVGGTMVISWGKHAEREVFLSKVYRRHYNIERNAIRNGTFPIGVDVNGNPFCISLNKEESPHAMIVGSTGAGKTVAAMAIVIGALRQGWDVYILNPKVKPQEKRLGLWDFKGFQGVTYIQNFQDMVSSMTLLCSTMAEYERPVLVMADELADTIDSMGKQVATPLGLISQKGREYDVHLVGITPKTTKSVLLDDMLHANSATTIIGLRTNSKYLSQYGSGIGGMNLETLSGNGHAMIRTGSTTTEVQVALPDNIASVMHTGGMVHEDKSGLLPITQMWIDSLPAGAKVSKDGLRRYASAHGNGVGYGKIIEQYNVLVESGMIDPGKKYQAGVKL